MKRSLIAIFMIIITLNCKVHHRKLKSKDEQLDTQNQQIGNQQQLLDEIEKLHQILHDRKNSIYQDLARLLHTFDEFKNELDNIQIQDGQQYPWTQDQLRKLKDLKVALRRINKRNELYKVKTLQYRDLLAKKEGRNEEQRELDLQSFISAETPGLLQATATDYVWEQVTSYLSQQVPHENRDLNHLTKTRVYVAGQTEFGKSASAQRRNWQINYG